MIKLDPGWGETSESLFQKSLETDSRRLRERFLALALVASGRTLKQVAAQLGRRRQTVAEWVERFNESGATGLSPGFKSKATASLTDEEFAILAEALAISPKDNGIDSHKWRSLDVAVFIKQRFGKEIHAETARRYIHRLNGKKKS